ncbi:proto-oncogene tyrosine- kinase ROS-like [Brachionus plicatilis]|uniref:Proto-oncogene tyrosine-kinase ROS-like n=1 Tax=Brachionus plicatilis TaxID=10195 RepID=A0A3M7P8X4_BRAPC|nr:proto-oncogene tyrosine- kinase ROS-like [Brachionus plicatilis]
MIFTPMFLIFLMINFVWDIHSYEIMTYGELNLVDINPYSNCSQVCSISYLKYQSLPISLDSSENSFSFDNKTIIEDGLCINAKQLAAENLYSFQLVNKTRLNITFKDISECKGLQFSVMITQISQNLSEIFQFRNIDNENFRNEKLEILIENDFNLNPAYTYEVIIRVNSLLDPRPFILGTYLINADFFLSKKKDSVRIWNMSIEDLGYDDNEPLPLRIENLKENTRYNLKLKFYFSRQGYSVVSSLISFRTVKMPEFHVEAINSSSILVKILADCHSLVYDYDFNLYFTHIASVCRSYTLKYRKKNVSSEYIYYADEMQFRHLSWSDTDIYELTTLPGFDYKQMLILINLLFCCVFVLTLIALKRKKIKFIFYKMFGKKYFMNHQNEMSVNLLYDWNKLANRKFLLNELQNLRKIREKSLVIVQKVGTGAFGEVFEGKLKLNTKSKESTARVAIKRLRVNANDSEKLDLLKEAIALNSFNHQNLVKFYGVCFPKNSLNKLEIKYIVLEFMNSGDLLSYLRQFRAKKESLEFKKAFKICTDIAAGCRYLERLKFLHRDLAARNCLINVETNNLTVKLADFGLARELYTSHKREYYKQVKDVHKLLPIRWMAPESLSDGVYTTKTDVWSFGIVVWEIITLGYLPYTGMNNLECVDFIINGGTLKAPNYCPMEIRCLLSKCWNKNSAERPSFEDIVKYLMLVEDNSHNFVKFSSIYHYDDIDIIKQLDHSKENSDEFAPSINSEILDSKENSIINESTSTEN